jgi:hypothetical protein
MNSSIKEKTYPINRDAAHALAFKQGALFFTIFAVIVAFLLIIILVTGDNLIIGLPLFLLVIGFGAAWLRYIIVKTVFLKLEFILNEEGFFQILNRNQGASFGGFLKTVGESRGGTYSQSVFWHQLNCINIAPSGITLKSEKFDPIFSGKGKIVIPSQLVGFSEIKAFLKSNHESKIFEKI